MINYYTEQFATFFSQRFDSYGLEHFETMMDDLLGELEKERETILTLLAIQIDTANLYQAYRVVIQDNSSTFINDNPSIIAFDLPFDYMAELYSNTAMTFITWQLKHGKNQQVISFVKELQQFLLKKPS